MEKQRENWTKENSGKKTTTEKEYPRTVDNKICNICISKIPKREDRIEHIWSDNDWEFPQINVWHQNPR